MMDLEDSGATAGWGPGGLVRINPRASMGLVYLADLYGFHVGKYTSPMDDMGMVMGDDTQESKGAQPKMPGLIDPLKSG